MSLDYPYYEELRRRKHPAAKWWLVGDRLYYLGLLSATFSIACAPSGILALLPGFDWGWFLFNSALVAFPVGIAVWYIGASLKRRAYKLAERDGISAAEVYARGAAGNESRT